MDPPPPEPVEAPHSLAEEADRQVMAFLRTEDFLGVKRAIIYLESAHKQLRVESLANFRDVLDHLSRAASAETPEDLAHHMTEAQEHLGRSVSDAYQEAIQDILLPLEKEKNRYYINAWVYPDLISQRDLEKRLLHIHEQLADVRDLKGDRRRFLESCESWRKIYVTVAELRIDTRPSKARLAFKIVVGAIGLLFTAAVFAVVGLVVVHYFG